MSSGRRSVVAGLALVASLALTVTIGGGLAPAATGAGASPGATSAVAPEGRGTWTVTPVGPDAYRVTWRSPVRLPVTSARPGFSLAGVPLPAPTLQRDGRTLTLVTTSPTEPRVDQLDVTLSGQVLDETLQPPPAPEPYVAPPRGRRLAADPGELGPYAVVSSDYQLADLPIHGFPAPVERLGHVVRPATPTPEPAPLVLFLHGRHDFCYGTPDDPDQWGDWPCPAGMQPVPSQLGYRYVQRLLASQGYVTVSIAANGINAQDWNALDGGAAARARLVRSHLQQWSEWAADGTYQVDMGRVVLVGHSRGGEGVNLASIQTPLDAAYRIVGQVLLAPTDFARSVAAYVPTVTVLSYCDGDVFDLQGQAYTDLARDLAPGDTALRSTVLVMGANHNFYNTEWTPGISRAPSWDDGGGAGGVCAPGAPTRLTAAGQRAVARTWITGAVDLMAGGRTDVLPMFDGSDVEVPSAEGADVRTQALGLGRTLRRPGRDAAALDLGRAASRICIGTSGGRDPRQCGDVGGITPHWVMDSSYTHRLPTDPAWEVSWRRAGADAGLLLDRPWDLGGADRLDLRTVVDPAQYRVRLAVRLRDGSGNSQLLTPVDHGVLHRLPGPEWGTKLVAQTLRVPLAGASGVDLTDVRRVDLVGRSDAGHVWVLDLAGGTAAVPPVPERRLPQVVVHDTRVLEGDVDGSTTAAVPFDVVGTLTRPARFVFVATDPMWYHQPQSAVVRLPAGTTGGTLQVRYDADTRDDRRRTPRPINVYGDRGAMPSRFTPLLTVVDDDPAPRITVRAAHRTVAEGTTVRWVVRQSAPADYWTTIRARAIDLGLPHPLRVGDLPADWVADRIGHRPPDTPLADTRLWFYALIEPGQTGATLELPTRRDAVAEPPETVSLRIHVQRAGAAVVRTVRVRDVE